MSAEWQGMLLGDFVELKRGYDLPKKQRTAGEVPLVSSAGVSDTHGEAKVAGPGVVTGRYGTIGEVYYVEEDFWPLNTTLYVRDFKGNVPKFVYYFLKTIDYLQYSDKAAVPGVNRNHLHTAEILVPTSTDMQQRIAEILAVLDDKIQLNHQINQTLEQMAQAIFKSWFVDFEPVKAKIAARKHWLAMQPANESASPVCYASDAKYRPPGDESPAVDLETAISLAAMRAISGRFLTDAGTDPLARLQAEQPAQYAELRATAALFPAAMQDSELGDIPEGWVAGNLKYIAKYPNDRVSTEELTLGTYVSTECMIENKKGVAPATSIPTTTAVPSFKPNQVLVSNIRPYFKKIWLARYTGGRSPDVLCFDCIDNQGHEFLFNVLYQDSFFDYMMRTSKGAKMPRGDKKAVMEFELTIPSSQLIAEYSQRISGFYKLAALKSVENNALEQLRDSLLPKLLSGELTLPEAQTPLQDVVHA